MTSELRSDIRGWLKNQTPLMEPLAEALKLPSVPATVIQNDVLDLVMAIVGDVPGVRIDRWVPDWEVLVEWEAPLDRQRLWAPLHERDPRYVEVLPALECLVFVLERGPGPTLMINGHVDVVPADNQTWSSPAFRPTVRHGRVIGRGAMDMKGGLVAAAMAFRYLATRWQGSGKLLFAVVPEEETGGNGTLAVLRKGYVPDAAVFTEPTDLQVLHRHVGIQGFSVIAEGRPGGMLRRSWGDSVAPAVARAALALEQLELSRTIRAKRAGGYDDDDLPGFVNFTLSAGDWIATRPGHGRIDGLMGVLPGETQEEAVHELEAAVAEATSREPVQVKVQGSVGGHRGGELAVSHELVQAFATDHRAGAPGAPSCAGTMVCDAKIVQGGGWAPSIVLGPIGGNLHAADEWVDLASLDTVVELVATGAMKYLQPTGTN